MLIEDIKVGSLILKEQDLQVTFTTKIGDFTFNILTKPQRAIVNREVALRFGNSPISARDPSDHDILTKAMTLDAVTVEGKEPEGWKGFAELPEIMDGFTGHVFSKYIEWLSELRQAKDKELEVVKS